MRRYEIVDWMQWISRGDAPYGLVCVFSLLVKKQMKSSNKFWIVACVLYFLIILSIMLVADMGLLVNFPLAHPPYDKLGHFILYRSEERRVGKEC